MKKFINNIKIFFAILVLGLLASCNNGNKTSDFYDDGKTYLSFSVNDNRSVYNPIDLKESDITVVKLYCMKKDSNDLYNYDKYSVNVLQEWTFLPKDGKSAMQVFEEESVVFEPTQKMKEDNKNSNYYNFIVELCTDELKAEKDNQVYYTPVHYAIKERVLLVPGLNTLSFETERYRPNNWSNTKYKSILNFEYTSIAGEGVGYMQATLDSWPYNEEIWFGQWDIIQRKDVDPWKRPFWEAEKPDDSEIVTLKGFGYYEDGYYTLNVKLYDHKDGKLLQTVRDIVYFNGYKTVIPAKEVSVVSNASSLKYGIVSIDDPWNLCKNKGAITITDTIPLDENENRTYSVQLKFGNDVVASNAEGGKLAVTNNVINWNENLFEGKASELGAYACKLVIDNEEQTFDVVIPDRTYLEYSVNTGTGGEGAIPYLDPENPPSELAAMEGNLFIHLTGEGENQVVASNWNRTHKTIGKYATTLLENLSENAHVFVDLSAVTGVTLLLREDVKLGDSGAWIDGIAIPESVVAIDCGAFMCPIKQADAKDDRYYELTVVLGENVYHNIEFSEENGLFNYTPSNYIFNGLVAIDDNVYTNKTRNVYNPFKKFIVSNKNKYISTNQDGSLLIYTQDDGWTILVASADIIEDLEVPSNIGKIEFGSFGGNRKLKSVSDWGKVREVCWKSFQYSNIQGELILGDNIGWIGEDAFADTKIESIILSDSVKLFSPGFVPENTYIGYKPGSNTKEYWVCKHKLVKTDANADENEFNYVGAYYGEQPYPDPEKHLIIKDLEKTDVIKYKNYFGISDFNDYYCWKVDY